MALLVGWITFYIEMVDVFFFNMSKKYLKFPQLCMFTKDFCGDPKTSPGYCLFVLNRPGKVLATKTEAASWTLKQSTQNMWEIYYIIDHTSMYIHCRWGWIYSCSLWMEFHSITRIAGAILGFRCSMFTKKELVFHRNTPGKKNMCIVQMTWIQKLSIKYVFINVSCIWSQLLWTVYLVLLSSHLQNMLCWANRFGAALP